MIGRRSIAVVVVMIAAALPVSGASAQPDDRANVQATLIRVDVFHAAKGKPQPTSANCSDNVEPDTTEWAPVGWVSAGGTAHLNTSTVPAGLNTAEAALQRAFSAWSTRAGAPAFTVVPDGSVTRQTANRHTDLLFGRVSGSAIAVTYTWRWSDGMMESDTLFNRSLPWADLGAEGDGCYEDRPVYDLENIAAHEFGHIYGLDHPSPGRFQTMYAYGYTGETLKRTPASGDLEGIRALYSK